MVATEADIEREASRLIAAARTNGQEARLLGGLAIARHCPSAQRNPVLRRAYADIDIIFRRSTRRTVVDLVESLGYAGDHRFNALHGGSRLLFSDSARDRQVDVFLGTFRMCHTLDLQDRFFPGYDCLPLADLILTKLQIVELNEKDAKDAMTIFLDHELSDREDDNVIDVGRIKHVCCADWGFYTTVTDNLQKLHLMAADSLGVDDSAIVAARIDRLTVELDRSAKSLKWRFRSRVGRRMAWYELPEEVQDALT